MMPCHFISRPHPGAMAWAKFSLALVKATKLSLLRELLQLRPQNWKAPWHTHMRDVHIGRAGECLTTDSQERRKSWFVALEDFHGVNNSDPGQFRDSQNLMSLCLEGGKRRGTISISIQKFPPCNMGLQQVNLL